MHRGSQSGLAAICENTLSLHLPYVYYLTIKIKHWENANAMVLRNLQQMVNSLKEESHPDFSMLSVVVSELSRLK